MAGFYSVDLCSVIRFHCSFLFFFLIVKTTPRFQHFLVSPPVCSTHGSCATNAHLTPAYGDDKVYHVPVSRPGARPNRLVFIPMFKHGVAHYHIELSVKGP